MPPAPILSARLVVFTLVVITALLAIGLALAPIVQATSGKKSKKPAVCTLATMRGSWGFLFEGHFTDSVKKVVVDRNSIGYMNFDGKGGVTGQTIGKYSDAINSPAVAEDIVQGSYQVTTGCKLSISTVLKQSNRSSSFLGFLEHDHRVHLIQMTPGVAGSMELQAMGKIGKKGCSLKTLKGKYVYSVVGNATSYAYRYSYTGFDVYDGKGNSISTTIGNPEDAELSSNSKLTVDPGTCLFSFDFAPDPETYLGIVVNEGERYFYVRTDPGGFETAVVVKAKI